MRASGGGIWMGGGTLGHEDTDKSVQVIVPI